MREGCLAHIAPRSWQLNRRPHRSPSPLACQIVEKGGLRGRAANSKYAAAPCPLTHRSRTYHVIARVIDPELLRFLPARILVDERGFAKTLLERVDALDQKGPPLLPEGEDEMVRVWYAKMMVRIARGDLESKYRRVELLFQALENYFKLRGLWYRGPKAGLRWLARHDPETHIAFARALEPHASLEDLRALVQRVLPAQ